MMHPYTQIFKDLLNPERLLKFNVLLYVLSICQLVSILTILYNCLTHKPCDQKKVETKREKSGVY